MENGMGGNYGEKRQIQSREVSYSLMTSDIPLSSPMRKMDHLLVPISYISSYLVVYLSIFQRVLLSRSH